MTRFRILCPRNTLTGGPEALHQLGAAMREAGLDAAMVYVPLRPDNRTPDKFLRYGVPVRPRLEDDDDVVLVVGETATEWVWRARRAHVLIWWLSVDFHFKRPEKWSKRARLWLRERLPRNRAYAFQPHPRVHHAWQSEYARQFLLRRGVADALPLTDYIAPALTVPEDELPTAPRRDVCLYNPRKGFAFTQQLIAACAGSGIEFLPLQGYTEAQLRGLFGTSKLYIDFGEHPGRDRIPREAAASGCVVVTGRRGSAANAIDVPLPDFYKVDENAPGVLALLRERLAAICADDAAHRSAQAPYRAWIRPQRDIFRTEAAALGPALSRAR